MSCKLPKRTANFSLIREPFMFSIRIFDANLLESNSLHLCNLMFATDSAGSDSRNFFFTVMPECILHVYRFTIYLRFERPGC